MRKVLFFLLLVMLMTSSTSFASVVALDEGLKDLAGQISLGLSEGKKRTIAVVEFSDLDGKTTEFGKFISEELITRLFMLKKFQVVERQLLNKIIQEHKLNMVGVIDQSTAKELGKILGVDAICSGTITDLINSIKINKIKSIGDTILLNIHKDELNEKK